MNISSVLNGTTSTANIPWPLFSIDEEKGSNTDHCSESTKQTSSELVEEETTGVEEYLNLRSFIANFTLVIGYTLGLWFQIYEFTGRDREPLAIAVYFAAFLLLIMSGLLELSLDTFSVRSIGHGRYHADSPLWNSLISSYFILAGILDIAAFFYWLWREPFIERVILLVSSCILFVMAILTLYFQIIAVKKESWTGTTVSDKIDLAANGLVLVVTVLGVLLRHKELSSNDFGEVTIDRLELATVPIWLFSSMMYAYADVLRLQTMTEDGKAWRM